jgi:2-dehydro-3-deoxyphosphogluconate aldolase/(4S)-4-hydroxy-2-oxoglutarate aldolase
LLQGLHKMELVDLTAYRVIPLITLASASHADVVGDALVRGGLPLAEVTLRTESGLESIRALAERGDLVVGAGSVSTASQVSAAAEAGASFIVSPGIEETVVLRARERGLPLLAGVATASEIMTALRLGLNTVKFFPAAVMGGVTALRALAAPFPGVDFVPTGGIGEHDAPDYLALPQVRAVGGSWMLPARAIESGDTEQLDGLIRRAALIAAQAPRDAADSGQTENHVEPTQ